MKGICSRWPNIKQTCILNDQNGTDNYIHNAGDTLKFHFKLVRTEYGKEKKNYCVLRKQKKIRCDEHGTLTFAAEPRYPHRLAARIGRTRFDH